MPEHARELEGTWEEILAHAPEFAGRRIRLTVLEPETETAPDQPPLSPRNQRMLDVFNEWQRTPLTGEEARILDEFPQFRQKHPFALRRIEAA